MLCPCCREELIIVEVHGVEVDLCIGGDGLWFDHDELDQLFLRAGVPQELAGLEDRLARLPQTSGAKRRCPRCRARLVHVSLAGAAEGPVLDSCPRGHGLWFDPGELEALADQGFSADVDSLDHVRQFLQQFLHPNDTAS